MSSKNIFSLVFIVSFAVIAAYGIIRWLALPAGTLVDWATGLLAFWWLLAVTTVPWDMYFKAREILNDARISTEKNIAFNPTDALYAHRIARIYLLVAIGLHLLTAGVLYALAFFQVSAIGYWASALALLLTFVRPLYRLHEHIVQRLIRIGQSVLYPREDMLSLQSQVGYLENRMLNAETDLNRENEYGWAATQVKAVEMLKNDIRDLKVALEQMKVENLAEHQQLAKKAEDSLAKLSEDARFLNQVSELIRFIKNA